MYKRYNAERHAFYEKLMFPKGYETYHKLTYENKLYVKTDTLIKFKDIEFGDSIKIVRKKLGSPRFTIKSLDIAPLVYFYKEDLMQRSIIVQLFFFDDKFLFATQTIFDMDNDWKETIKEAIFEKYIDKIESKLNNQLNEVCFVDKANNKLIVFDSISLHILYVSGNQDNVNLIKAYKQRLKNEKNSQLQNLKTLILKHF